MTDIRLGTIGSGPIVHWILDAVAATDGISCEAVYSRTLEKGRELADQYQVEKVYTDLEELMNDPVVNTIYVASPNSLHHEQTEMALRHGKNVICEKPFCSHVSEVDEVIALAKERNLFLVDAVTIAFLPNFELLKEKLPDIGRVRIALCNYTQYSSRYTKLLEGEVTNIFDPAFEGGSLQDINFYNIWFMVALFGKPKAITYYANTFPDLADTSGIALMIYDDFVGSCVGSKDAHGQSSIQIEGEKGCLYVDGAVNDLLSVRVVTDEADETYNLQEEKDRYGYEIEAITRYFLTEDHEAIDKRLSITRDVIDTMEKARFN